MGFFSNRETRVLKKYGIKDPKLHEALKDMAQEYSKNYFLQGTPTKNLKSILEMSPDPLLDLLAKSYQIKGSLKREQLENRLYESIIQSVSREFLFLSDKDEAILRKIASGRKPSRKEVEEVAAIMDAFGWSFSFTDRIGRVFSVMPAEVAECYLKESNNLESQQERRLFYEIRKAAVICANLYGIFEKTALLQILKQCVLSPETLPEEMDDSELWKSVRRSMDAMLERSDFIWKDKEYYINEAFQTRPEYKSFVKRLQNREYFLPSRKEAQAYLADHVDRNKIEYKCLRASILSVTRNKIITNEWLFEIEELVIKDGADFREVLETMFHDGIACSTSPKMNTIFEEDLQNWIHTVRKWKNRGFSDVELGKPLSETQSQKISAEKTKKIGRNAPCPCGSGKKYKHCCMNKSSV